MAENEKMLRMQTQAIHSFADKYGLDDLDLEKGTIIILAPPALEWWLVPFPGPIDPEREMRDDRNVGGPGFGRVDPVNPLID